MLRTENENWSKTYEEDSKNKTDTGGKAKDYYFNEKWKIGRMEARKGNYENVLRETHGLRSIPASCLLPMDWGGGELVYTTYSTMFILPYVLILVKFSLFVQCLYSSCLRTELKKHVLCTLY